MSSGNCNELLSSGDTWMVDIFGDAGGVSVEALPGSDIARAQRPLSRPIADDAPSNPTSQDSLGPGVFYLKSENPKRRVWD